MLKECVKLEQVFLGAPHPPSPFLLAQLHRLHPGRWRQWSLLLSRVQLVRCVTPNDLGGKRICVDQQPGGSYQIVSHPGRPGERIQLRSGSRRSEMPM